MSLQKLIEISNKYGCNPDMVLAGGGNTSFKDDEYLYIKSSGVSLADAGADGFVRMRRSALREILNKSYSESDSERESAFLADLMNAREIFPGEIERRPSVETLLHELFVGNYVVHLHPAAVNGMTCGQNGRETAAELFGEQAVWLDEIKPGYTLAIAAYRAIAEKTARGESVCILFHQNHGVFVAAETIDGIERIYEKILDRIHGKIDSIIGKPPFVKDFPELDRHIAALAATAIREILRSKNSGSFVTFRSSTVLLGFLENNEKFYPVSSAYTPDHIVYCRAYPLYIDAGEKPDVELLYKLLQTELHNYTSVNGYPPRIIAVRGLGIFAHGDSAKQSRICADVFMDTVKIAGYSTAFGGCKFMSGELIDFIINWEVESYRAGVSAGKSGGGYTGKVAVVTGAAQGLGLHLAESLLKRGACVVLADIKYDEAAARSKEFNAKYSDRAIAIKLDAGDEESIKNMVYETSLNFGGIDVFINNAGIVFAGGIGEMDAARFDLVTRINYTAFFMCVKYAGELMKTARRFGGAGADIIEINSKSGLEGSKNNFAYAGSKFGGIGLVQSFALELAEFAIKVNAVCPGNLLDGALWSDPERGLFVQYLRAGKVPGAKTIADVRKFYEDKVPLRRGCDPCDVARAVFYAIEQQYETGQAIPVTGGQIMLN